MYFQWEDGYYQLPYPVILTAYPTPEEIWSHFFFFFFAKWPHRMGTRNVYLDLLPGELRHFSTASWKLVGMVVGVVTTPFGKMRKFQFDEYRYTLFNNFPPCMTAVSKKQNKKRKKKKKMQAIYGALCLPDL